MNFKILPFATLAILFFAGSSFGQSPLNGLVAYYPFSANALDSSGFGNDGVVYGATLATDRFGHPNSAYYFNGIDSYIKVSNAPILNNPDFTYSWWMKADTFLQGNSANIFEIGSQDFYGGHYGQTFSVNYDYQNTLGWYIGTGDVDFNHTGFQTGYLPDLHTWYNVVVTRDNTAERLFVNGQLQGYELLNGALPYYETPLDFYIGARCQLFLDQYFQGIIDDISVYDRALSSGEIITLSGSGDIKKTNAPLSILQNPNNGLFKIKSAEFTGDINISITDKAGRRVYQMTFKNSDNQGEYLAINLANQPKGTYFVMATDVASRYSGSVVIQ